MAVKKTKPRKRTCKAKGCTNKITPWNSLHVACSTRCAVEITQTAKEKAERQRLKRDLERIKSRSQWMKEAQQAFNSFIRERDKDKPCISCGSYSAGQYHAGHYRTTKAAPELRFSVFNCHKQCAQCNNFESGNIVEYRLRLIDRIGRENVEWLEGPHAPKKYTIDELKEIKRHYQNKKRELLNAPSQNPLDR